jgi:hypothetical protein
MGLGANIMSFVKVGDEVKIEGMFDGSGKEKYCPDCGRKLKVIAVADEENELICDCKIEIPERSN